MPYGSSAFSLRTEAETLSPEWGVFIRRRWGHSSGTPIPGMERKKSVKYSRGMAVPSAMRGKRLGGPVVDDIGKVLLARATVWRVREGQGAAPVLGVCDLVDADVGGGSISCGLAASACVKEAPPYQYSVAELLAMIFGWHAWPPSA